MFEMLSIPFIQKALMVSSLVGVFFAFVGVYVVLRRIVFVSIALSQLAACGFAFGLLTGFNPSLYSLIFTLGGVIIFSFHAQEKRITRESFIGFMYAFFSSLGIIFLAKSHEGEGSLLDMFSGNILTITTHEIYIVIALFVSLSLVQIVFYRRFIFVFFDGETAKTHGVSTNFYNFLFYFLLGLMISASVRTTGVLLSFAYLTIPAMTALLLTERMKWIFVISILISLLSTFIGIYISFLWDLPSGTTNVAVLCLGFIMVLVMRYLTPYLGRGNKKMYNNALRRLVGFFKR